LGVNRVLFSGSSLDAAKWFTCGGWSNAGRWPLGYAGDWRSTAVLSLDYSEECKHPKDGEYMKPDRALRHSGYPC